MESKESLSILPMHEDKGFEKSGICNFHYWNVDQTLCLRCGIRFKYERNGDRESFEYSMTIPMAIPKNKKHGKG